ncbi:MAG: hypothetical protein IJ220_08250 [Clostridia bacterium]|nr:hypothetical protein [Clostridia bacterium]
MATVTSGVYPVFNNVFKIGTAGRSSAAADMKTIADCETFSLSMDNNVEEWTPMTTEGWIRRMQTGKGFSISISGKRNVGDDGNDYVASKLFATGQDVETVFEWEFADGTKVSFNCIISVSNAGTGDSTNVAPLEFEVMSDGAPTITPAA